MKALTIERMGTEVQGVTLRGQPKVRPEPEYFRVVLPFGDVDIVRTEDGEYWVHVRVNSAEQVATEEADRAGRITDARLDIRGKHASETDAGDFGHEELYHLAVRVGPVK